MTTFCQFVIMVGDSGGNVSQVRTTWFLSWKLSIFFLIWAHLPTLYIALELTFLRWTLHLSSPSYIVHRIWAHLSTLYIALELTFLHFTLHLSSPSFIVHCTWAHLPTLYIAFKLTFLHCILHLSSPSYFVHRIWAHLPSESTLCFFATAVLQSSVVNCVIFCCTMVYCSAMLLPHDVLHWSIR